MSKAWAGPIGIKVNALSGESAIVNAILTVQVVGYNRVLDAYISPVNIVKNTTSISSRIACNRSIDDC